LGQNDYTQKGDDDKPLANCSLGEVLTEPRETPSPESLENGEVSIVGRRRPMRKELAGVAPFLWADVDGVNS
jgi:hypothetical protein